MVYYHGVGGGWYKPLPTSTAHRLLYHLSRMSMDLQLLTNLSDTAFTLCEDAQSYMEYPSETNTETLKQSMIELHNILTKAMIEMIGR